MALVNNLYGDLGVTDVYHTLSLAADWLEINLNYK
jgi:hypothetical protein